MAFQRAILPAVLSWADKLVMIGKYWNTYLIACQSYIYYIALYGRTIVIGLSLLINLYSLLKIAPHVLCSCGSLYDFIGRVHDTLCEVRGVYHRPLRLACH